MSSSLSQRRQFAERTSNLCLLCHLPSTLHRFFNSLELYCLKSRGDDYLACGSWSFNIQL